MIEGDASTMQARWQPMKVPAERIRDWLRHEVIIQAGEIAPAGVAPELDQTCAEHVAEQHPSPDIEEEHARRGSRRPQENGKESRFKQQRFPSETIEDLSDIDERQVQHPERGPGCGGHEAGSLQQARRQSS